MTSEQSPNRLAWWNPALSSSYATMLLDYAVRTGENVRSATFHGVLSDACARGRDELFRELATGFQGEILLHKEPLDAGIIERLIVFGDGFTTVRVDEDHKVFAEVFSLDPEKLENMNVLLGDLTYGAAGRQPIYALAQEKGDIVAAEIGVVKQELERGNYNEAVIDEFDRIVQELNSDDPAGRLVIFEGEPGTGKSFLVCALMDVILDSVFLLVPPQMVADLASPSLIPTLVRMRKQMGITKEGTTKPIILVIEDADHCLRERPSDVNGEAEVGPITALLNLSDGLLGRALNLRVICTTNVAQENIDPALNRPRRLLAHVHVDNLDPDRAMAVYDRLTGTEDEMNFGAPLSLAAVYDYAANPSMFDEEPIPTTEGDEEDIEEDDDEDEGDDADEEDDEEEAPEEEEESATALS